MRLFAKVPNEVIEIVLQNPHLTMYDAKLFRRIAKPANMCFKCGGKNCYKARLLDIRRAAWWQRLVAYEELKKLKDVHVCACIDCGGTYSR